MGNLNLGAQESNAPLPGGAILDGTISLAELAESLKRFLVPIGAILPYGGTGTPPSGFVYCDGSLHNTTGTCTECGLIHTELASVLSNAYGGVLGTSFRVPDLRGRVPMGVGVGAGDGLSGAAGTNPSSGTMTSRVRGEWGGALTHLLSGAESGVQAHSTASAGDHGHAVNDGGSHSHTASTSAAGNHEHGYTASYDQNWRFNITAVSSGGNTVNKGTFGAATGTAGSHSHAVTVDSGGSHSHTIVNNGSHSHSVNSAPATSAHNNVQPYVVVNYIIKAI